jgi:hypothetical protein
MNRRGRIAGVVALTGGLLMFPSLTRAQATTAEATRPAGKEVTVTGKDGSRQTGKLLSFTSTQLVLRRRNGDVTLPLANVRQVLRDSHWVRNSTLIGLAAGAGIGIGSCFASGYCRSLEDATDEVMAVLVTGIGAGTGALIGVATRPSASSRTIYLTPGTTALSVTPVLGKGAVGVGGTIRW